MQYQCIAKSVAGTGTTIAFPTLDIAFDCGIFQQETLSCHNLFITHQHFDHLGAFLQYIFFNSWTSKRLNVYVPAPLTPKLHKLIKAQADVVGEKPGGYKIIPMVQDQKERIRHLTVQAFPSIHRVPTQGYVVSERREKLTLEMQSIRDILDDKNWTEFVVKAKRAGTVISGTKEVPLVAFCGDTQIEVLDQNPMLYKVHTLVLECTILEDTVGAKKWGHVCLKQIAERAHLFENKELLLTHTSLRHNQKEILDALKTDLPPELLTRTKVLNHHGQWLQP